MGIEDDEVALYLNLAASKTRTEGNIKWLTESVLKNELPAVSSESQETQCITFNNCIWIANNDDRDTIFQYEFLNLLGVDSRDALFKHVQENRSRVLKHHKNKFVITDSSKPKEKLMAEFSKTVHNSATNFAPFVLPANRGKACIHHSLSSPTAPPGSGVVFITGSYEKIEGDSEHAEQKLMAALGKYVKISGMFGKVVRVGGCKSACDTCRGVLKSVKERLRMGPSYSRLWFDDPDLIKVRDDVGLGVAHPVNIKKLDIAFYFPEKL